MVLALLFLQVQVVAQSLTTEQLMARVTEEAETLRQNARLALTEEKLEQRVLRPQTRSGPAIGQSAIKPAPPKLQTREIVSEYSIGSLGAGDSERLMEFRQVVSVDGKPVQTTEKARHALSLGLTSREDKARKRMLEDFEHHGLVGAVTDFGTLLLQFTKRGIRELRITPAGTALIGPDRVQVFAYEQISGTGGVLDFQHRKAVRYPLKGQLAVRASDGLPLRITAGIHRVEDGHEYDDQGTVDYVQTTHGFVGPVAVVHRGFVDKQMVIENHFTYGPFHRFGADAEIKFTEVPDPPPAPSPAPKR